MNNSVFWKTMESVTNYRDIKLVTTNEKRNKLVSEPNYHTTKTILENSLIIEMKMADIKMNIHLRILEWLYQTKIWREQNYVTLILTVLSFILKLNIFAKTLLMMLKDGLIYLTMMRMMKDCFQQVKTKNDWSF